MQILWSAIAAASMDFNVIVHVSILQNYIKDTFQRPLQLHVQKYAPLGGGFATMPIKKVTKDLAYPTY